MELYLPPTYAKITRGCEYYETTETFLQDIKHNTI